MNPQATNSDDREGKEDPGAWFLRILDELPEPVYPPPRSKFPALPSTGSTDLDHLLTDLGNENWQVVEHARMALSKSGDLRVLPPLFALLTEAYSPYQFQALLTLELNA